MNLMDTKTRLMDITEDYNSGYAISSSEMIKIAENLLKIAERYEETLKEMVYSDEQDSEIYSEMCVNLAEKALNNY